MAIIPTPLRQSCHARRRAAHELDLLHIAAVFREQDHVVAAAARREGPASRAAATSAAVKPEYAAAWQEAYGLIQEVMLSGAAAAAR